MSEGMERKSLTQVAEAEEAAEALFCEVCLEREKDCTFKCGHMTCMPCGLEVCCFFLLFFFCDFVKCTITIARSHHQKPSSEAITTITIIDINITIISC